MKRPFVTVSYAQSADGRIATSAGNSQWISGSESLLFTHTLRRDNQAILVGIGTVLKDDPLLTCRMPEASPSPVRIIIDSHVKIPEDSRILQTASVYRSIVFYCSAPSTEKITRLSSAGMELYKVDADTDGRVDLLKVMPKLVELGLETLFVEGGAEIITSFLRLDLVDKLWLVCAPLVIGKGIEGVGDLNIVDLSTAPRGTTKTVRQAGEDIIWEISFRKPPPVRIEDDQLTGRTARSLYFTAPHTIEIREENLRGEPGEILVRSRAIGISHGTEIHIYNGSFPRSVSQDGLDCLKGDMEYPLKYGYMNAGITEDGRRVFAFFPHQDLFYVQEKDCIEFPAAISFEDIALYPSVETAYNILLDTRPLPGERILIVGLGMIGLLTAEILAGIEGLHIMAVEPDPFRLQAGKRLGLPCFSPEPSDGGRLVQTIRSVCAGELPDKTIHLSGTEEGLQTAIDCTGFEGTIIEGSWYGSRGTSLKLGEAFHRRRLSIRSSQVSHVSRHLYPRWNRSRRTLEALGWVKRIQPSKYISHRYPLDEAQRAFEDISAGRDGVLQVLLLPEGDGNVLP